MVLPSLLRPSDTVAFVLPSAYMSPADLQPCVQQFQKWGFKTLSGKTVGYLSENYFSAPDAVRLQDVQDMLDHPGVRAIIMGRGGYGMGRIIDGLCFETFKKYPKWICGFSDITLLHLHLQKLGFGSLHATMAKAFIGAPQPLPRTITTLHRALTQETYSYTVSAGNYYQCGAAEGLLAGGNLSLIVSSLETASEISFKGKILVIEEVDEYLYRIDRMLGQLYRKGVFQQIAGLIWGQFAQVQDTAPRPFGVVLEDLLRFYTKDLSVPVCYGFPVGHTENNWALRMGQRHRLRVDAAQVVLSSV